MIPVPVMTYAYTDGSADASTDDYSHVAVGSLRLSSIWQITKLDYREVGRHW